MIDQMSHLWTLAFWRSKLQIPVRTSPSRRLHAGIQRVFLLYHSQPSKIDVGQ
ncbi:hypothetical protein ACLOJK_011417 [Asimina triloba]